MVGPDCAARDHVEHRFKNPVNHRGGLSRAIDEPLREVPSSGHFSYLRIFSLTCTNILVYCLDHGKDERGTAAYRK
jgi:hypothetical protein